MVAVPKISVSTTHTHIPIFFKKKNRNSKALLVSVIFEKQIFDL